MTDHVLPCVLLTAEGGKVLNAFSSLLCLKWCLATDRTLCWDIGGKKMSCGSEPDIGYKV